MIKMKYSTFSTYWLVHQVDHNSLKRNNYHNNNTVLSFLAVTYNNYCVIYHDCM